ncbi:YbeD family protein [Larsenimonas rhizosphaerae]|uniref:DUF493 domain-containing protein n=1 Tax=Larsenimonas rhizosphaerae TaxID=2944682 RepID=A0AA42CTY0_9GAMM|nr:DUF493 domain-containing protein [Larsenimonas rhizosphaerae]MCM2130832.1 DUF493 domain-containing protein [Larsenimonas rhizosphaerae]MCX2523536.1 DUF493 domain-containing protein [Larsenimonas rhizosphaerae]
MSASDELVDYPRDYGLRVVGDNVDQLELDVIALMEEHCGDSFDPDKVTTQPSSNGTYMSVRVSFRAESPQHLSLLFRALQANKRVRMVL